MITVKIPMSGTDEHGKPFSAAPGDVISLDKKSEANYIEKGLAEPAKQRAVAKKKK